MITLTAASPIGKTQRTLIDDGTVSKIKQGIWIYFFLLIFEGALRKWVLPSLAGPLLIVRDPVALWILFLAWKRGLLVLNQYSGVISLIGGFSIFTAFFLGHGNLYVALYGARILLIHFPLLFIIAKVFEKKDVVKIGKAMLLISIPMILLIMLQFYSPQTAWINKSVGGEAGGGFSGALNYYRPPGTFSFTNGNTLFFDLLTCFVIYFWFNKHDINRFVLIGSTIALLLAIPFSISRSLFFQVIISIGFAVISTLFRPKYAVGMIVILAALFGILLLLSFSSYFNNATLAFTTRFESANSQEGGLNGVLLDRFLGGMVEAVALSSHQPFFGYGIGLGTNVGSMLSTGGRTFLISEGEWGRTIGEVGPVLGLLVIFLRCKLAVSMLYRSFTKLKLYEFLPWILSSVSFLSVAQAGWAQPTSLGFCVLVGGLTFASFQTHTPTNGLNEARSNI